MVKCLGNVTFKNMIGWPIFRFLSYPISFLFPGYLSFKAVLSNESCDDSKWLSYWLLVAFLFLIEVVFDLIVNSFPFYFEIKCVLLMWLQWNSARNAWYLFEHFFEPVFSYYEPHIDAFLEKYSQSAERIFKKVKSAVDAGMASAIRNEAEKKLVRSVPK